MKIKCLIDHDAVVFKDMIFEVVDKEANQVCVIGLDNYPVWLSEDYSGVKEFEVISE